MVFDKLFNWFKKKGIDPQISFGRYSDNNKSSEKVEKWTEADTLFKQQDYPGSIRAFFSYLTDDEQENVVTENKDGLLHFTIYQGSKLVRGTADEKKVRAAVSLALMPEPSIPVMRRLLELNFHLYYTRFALKADRVYMRFDSDLDTASPNKMYYGLKEIATKADKHDDLLLSEFDLLKPVDNDHIGEIPEAEKNIKYEYLNKWIRDTLDYISTLEAEKFSGAISYLLLTLVFRIDYLIAPEGKMLSDLEKIASSYYGKEDKQHTERNPKMIAGFKKILEKPKDEIVSQLFRAKYTFSIVVPHNLKQIGETIQTSQQNMIWYRDNNYPDIANKVMEYGFAYSQYSYSLPRPLTDLFRLFMQVNNSDYFKALGFATVYYDDVTNEFDEDSITETIEAIIGYWSQKYSNLSFKIKKLKFDTLLNFNHSFLSEVSELNFD